MLGVLVGVWMGTLEKQLNKWDFCGKTFGLGHFGALRVEVEFLSQACTTKTITTPAPAKPFPQIARGEEKLLQSDVLMSQTIPQEIVSACNAADKLSKTTASGHSVKKISRSNIYHDSDFSYRWKSTTCQR